MCIRQIYECNQLHRYILCVVGVIMCKKTFDTRHTDRADMQFKVVFLVALISVNTIWIISIYLAPNWAVSQWLSFKNSKWVWSGNTTITNCRQPLGTARKSLSKLLIWMHDIYCLCEQTAKVDRSHYNNSLSHHKLIRNFNLFQPYIFSKFSDRLYTCIVSTYCTNTQIDLCIIW